jgi:hypothetical protein
MEDKNGYIMVPKEWIQKQLEFNRTVVHDIEFHLPRDRNYEIIPAPGHHRYELWKAGARLSDAAESFLVFRIANRPRPPRKRITKRSPQLWLFPEMERRNT